MPSALRIRLYCCPRSRCTNRDWDESRAWWPPMRDFIRARTRRRDKHWGSGGCRCPTSTPRVRNGNFFSTSLGFTEVKSGEPVRRAESVWWNEDAGCGVGYTKGGAGWDDGEGGAVLPTTRARWGGFLGDRTPKPIPSTPRGVENGRGQNPPPRPYPLHMML